MQLLTFDETLRTLKHRVPFRPFTIELVDGKLVEIDRADAIAVRDGLGVYAAPGGIPVIFDYDGVNQIIGDLMERPGA